MAPKKKIAKKSAPKAATPGSQAILSRLDSIEAKLSHLAELLSKGVAPAGKSEPKEAAPAFSSSLDSTATDPDSAMFLSRTPLFAKLSPQECSILAKHCEVKDVGAGQKLFSEGDFGDAMYVLKQGVLEIFKKDLLGDVRIAEIRPGGLVGEMALVDGKPRSANVRAA